MPSHSSIASQVAWITGESQFSDILADTFRVHLLYSTVNQMKVYYSTELIKT